MNAYAPWLLLACAGAALAAPAPIAPRLDQYRCTICHAEHETLAGPAWADIAQRYRGEKHAAEIVAARIRGGVQGGGPWHMPPHPEVTQADADAMARYILNVPE